MKRDIIVSNRFTYKKANGQGSSGSTPGKFVLRYMSRDERGATEPLAPFTLDNTDAHIKERRYLARERHVDDLKVKAITHDNEAVKKELKALDGLGGRAFGSRNLSLSDRELKEDSRKIQKAFDVGHTAQLMVLSFSEKFLRDHHVLDDDFVYRGDGSYQNMYDQMKMRLAITAGVNQMLDVASFEKPVWVATLQTDTSHLHAHLAVVDTVFSDKRLMVDRSERGKIYDDERAALRHGIAHELDLMDGYRFRRKSKERDLENVKGLVKGLDFHEALYNHELQLIMGSLPDDKQLWQAESSSPDMRYPNEVTRQFVRHVFAEYGEPSGYDAALNRIEKYAMLTAENTIDYNRMRDNGIDRLETRAMNSIYDRLANVSRETSETMPKDGLLFVQSMDDNELKKAVSERGDRFEEFDPFGFELRTRAYQSRTQRHLRGVREHYEHKQEFDSQVHSDDALVMNQFYVNELLYHARLVDKYRSFSAFKLQWDEETRNEFEAIQTEYQAIKATEDFLTQEPDSIAQSFGYDDAADAKKHQTEFVAKVQGRTGVSNGHQLLSYSGMQVLEHQLEQERMIYQRSNQDYTYRAFLKGQLSSREMEAVLSNSSDAPFPPQPAYNLYTPEMFKQAQALDLHDLDVDFYGVPDVSFSKESIDAFTSIYNQRATDYSNAHEYLTATNQSVDVLRSTGRDLSKMQVVLNELYDGEYRVPELHYDEIESSVRKMDETITLDANVQVLQTVHDSLEFEL